MIVLVCGSRKWNDYRRIKKRLALLPKGSTIVHGGAGGADEQAGAAARALGFEEKVYPANWDRYGRKAGILRNIEMLETFPDLVIAFSYNNSPGTAHTVREAKKRRIPTEVHYLEVVYDVIVRDTVEVDGRGKS